MNNPHKKYKSGYLNPHWLDVELRALGLPIPNNWSSLTIEVNFTRPAKIICEYYPGEKQDTLIKDPEPDAETTNDQL